MKFSKTLLTVFFFAFSTLALGSPINDAAAKLDRCSSVPHSKPTQVVDKCNVPVPHVVHKSNGRCSEQMVRACKKGSAYCWNRC